MLHHAFSSHFCFHLQKWKLACDPPASAEAGVSAVRGAEVPEAQPWLAFWDFLYCEELQETRERLCTIQETICRKEAEMNSNTINRQMPRPQGRAESRLTAHGSLALKHGHTDPFRGTGCEKKKSLADRHLLLLTELLTKRKPLGGKKLKICR